MSDADKKKFKPTAAQVAAALQWADVDGPPITKAQERLIADTLPGQTLNVAALRILHAHLLGVEAQQPIRLTIRPRGGDFHCQLKGQLPVWDCGKTPEEAIGRWVKTHGADYGIEINDAIK